MKRYTRKDEIKFWIGTVSMIAIPSALAFALFLELSK